MAFKRDGVSSKFIQFYEAFTLLIRRIYVVFWHNLSLDPRVRASPYDPPPENEVKMTTGSILYYRFLRVWFLSVHIISVMTIIYAIQGRIKIPTIILGIFCLFLSALGSICGAHRYWSHKSFSATPLLELFLMYCHCMSAHISAFHWARLHRVHHKYSDTIADPHNAKAGFFFSQIGWVMIQRTPECKKAIDEIWCDDLRQNKLVMFQDNHWLLCVLPICFEIPVIVPWYFWNESFLLALGVVFTRYMLWIHMMNTVNSIAHFRGMRPFDKTIQPTDNRFTWFTTFGDEGWHNYHHAFPSDYKTSEFWGYRNGLCTLFIELCARLGLAYNLKTTTIEVAMKRRQRTGDLSCHIENWNTTHSKENLLDT